MRDVFSTEYAIQSQIRDILQTHLRGFGYTAIDLPIIENTELYLRKSGEDIASRLYEFNFKSRRIALRPEVTASILRAYVDKMQDDPLPIRLQYSGPVFRYEKPQQDRYRQFTMTGAEMLGTSGPIADAEMLYMACSGLEKLGITSYKLVIGYSEMLEDFLHQLGLRQQLLNFLLRNMENIRKRGLPYVIESLREIFPDLEFTAENIQNDASDDDGKGQQLLHILREMSNEEAHQAVTEFLHSLNIKIDTNRGEYDVIDRLLHKIREDEQGPKLRMALDYMQKLSELSGKPQQVLSDARNLLQDYDVESDTIVKIENLLDTLSWYGDLQGEVELDLGMNRGLHYYTGLMFEIHYPSDGEEDIQLCGGGRYDNLITVLGGNSPTPALGFAYGIERISRVINKESITQETHPDIYVIPLEPPDFAYAYSIANILRDNHHIVEVSVDNRSLKKSIKHADKRQARLVMIIGPTERRSQTAVIRDMQQHTEQTITYKKIAKTVEGLLADNV